MISATKGTWAYNVKKALRAAPCLLACAVALFLAESAWAQAVTYSGASVGANGTIYGWGVTDAYNPSMYHTAYVSTSLTSPHGRSAVVFNVEAPTWVRADLSLPWDANDLGFYPVSSVHWFWCDVGSSFVPSGETSGGIDVQPPTLICGSTIRGLTSACTLIDLNGLWNASEWKFIDGALVTNRTPASSSKTWSGVVVKSGIVSVKATGPDVRTLTWLLVVSARSGWAFNAVSPGKVQHGMGTGGCAAILPLLTRPPQEYRHLAKNCLYQAWPTPGVGPVPSGPNQGYKYTTSILNTGTLYQWHRNPDLEDTQSTFYQRQTGTNGCILGSNLATQTWRHEEGLTSTQPPRIQSHWYNYKTSQDNAANNLGVVAEKTVSVPSVSESQHRDAVNAAMQAKAAIIQAATGLENIYEVNFTETGTFLGNATFAPNYPPCQ